MCACACSQITRIGAHCPAFAPLSSHALFPHVCVVHHEGPQLSQNSFERAPLFHFIVPFFFECVHAGIKRCGRTLQCAALAFTRTRATKCGCLLGMKCKHLLLPLVRVKSTPFVISPAAPFPAAVFFVLLWLHVYCTLNES